MGAALYRWRGTLVAFLLLVTGVQGCHRWYYPYGWSHCCDLALGSALHDYARDHGGKYPSGEATPEASLSLLYPKYVHPEVLRGKTVPLAVAQHSLRRSGKLSPQTCGWHYVEGLTLKDEGVAIFWDKAGLDHNGGRDGDGRTVYRILHGREYIPNAEWQTFLKRQSDLRAAREARIAAKKIQMPRLIPAMNAHDQ